jgi:outer membrane receptor protein involved in Fe transport
VRNRAARTLCAACVLAVAPSVARAQTPPAPTPAVQTPATPQPLPSPTFIVTVIETAPLPGVNLPIGKIPSPVQIASADDIEQSGALDLADFLNRRLTGVFVNDIQNNPFQPDVNYRGYTASPLLGTPQGLSVYMDGVRLNQPFGDVVSWDLIPRMAIATTTLIPGSNPLFGLNTLGGALSIQTKDGLNARGTTVEALYGSDARRSVEFEHGGRKASGGVNWYAAGNLLEEDGWRPDSSSEIGQLFGKLGWQRPRHDAALTLAYADNSLNGNGLQDLQFLPGDFASVYTKPDVTDNRSAFVNVTTRHSIGQRTVFSGNAYYRDIRTTTLNGDINEDSLDQAIYQPGPAERAALAAAGYTGVPTSGADSTNTPFPFWRCIGNSLLQDEPAEMCNGLINRGHISQQNGGASGQFTRHDPFSRGTNQFTAGAAFDASGVGFVQSTELGYLNPDRSVTGVGAFGDGVTGGEVDGEPFDTRVDLDGRIRTWSLFATDTVSVGDRWNVTLSGRFNRTTVRNRDAIEPGGGPGSLDGDHVFQRFNPAMGVTFNPSGAINVYAGYGVGSRAATSIELGCADPEQPCKLPNAMAGDPPLEQVVTRTLEGGVRGHGRGISWSAGVFHAVNRDDILFVTSGQTGFGYFKNFGETRRQGFDLGVSGRAGRVTAGAGYTFLNATYQSEETVNGESNSSNDAGGFGLEGTIDIAPGDRIPLIPAHLLKTYADIQVTSALSVDLNLIAISGSYARGNENNRHEPDGVYYLGPGRSDAYAVVNLGGRYRVTRWLQVFAQVNNLFDTRYYTAAQLGPTGFTATGTFIARPLPAIDGEFPVRQSTFFAPGAPARAWGGVRLTF